MHKGVEKYIEYALKGEELDIASNDSATASFINLHLCNAFIQSGFVEEAEKYMENSFAYNPFIITTGSWKPKRHLDWIYIRVRMGKLVWDAERWGIRMNQ